MIINKYIRITRILFILSTISVAIGQSADELKRFMDTYDKLKVDQQANEVVKKGIESEKDSDDGPIRLIIDPGDMANLHFYSIIVLSCRHLLACYCYINIFE